jgi:hypothetical protein
MTSTSSVPVCASRPPGPVPWPGGGTGGPGGTDDAGLLGGAGTLGDGEPEGEPDGEPDGLPDGEPEGEPDGLPEGLPEGDALGEPLAELEGDDDGLDEAEALGDGEEDGFVIEHSAPPVLFPTPPTAAALPHTFTGTMIGTVGWLPEPTPPELITTLLLLVVGEVIVHTAPPVLFSTPPTAPVLPHALTGTMIGV